MKEVAAKIRIKSQVVRNKRKTKVERNTKIKEKGLSQDPGQRIRVILMSIIVMKKDLLLVHRFQKTFMKKLSKRMSN